MDNNIIFETWEKMPGATAVNLCYYGDVTVKLVIPDDVSAEDVENYGKEMLTTTAKAAAKMGIKDITITLNDI